MNTSGRCHYVKVISRNYPYVIYLHKTSDFNGYLKAQADCQQYRTRWVNNDGTKDAWKPTMPESVGLRLLATVCNM